MCLPPLLINGDDMSPLQNVTICDGFKISHFDWLCISSTIQERQCKGMGVISCKYLENKKS